ncbi:MAG: hypothetical protein OEO77_02245 [Acidimicrobiia bacterium]|nr:hypothetical protein [Acidimicrobiia bacterium]
MMMLETVVTVGDVEYLGAPLYGLLGEHAPAAALLTAAVAGWFLARALARAGIGWANRLTEPVMALAAHDRWLVALVGLSGIVHLGLALGHETGGWILAYGGAGFGLLWSARRLLRTGRRRPMGWMLAASVAGWVAASLGGSPPDQLAMLTKLGEVSALTIILSGVRQTGVRGVLRSAGSVSLFLVVAVGGWVGAMSAGEGGHHHGSTPPPGVLLPNLPVRDATPAEVAAAEALHAATVDALARYADPAVAGADGYDVDGIFGTDFHASNEAYKHDGLVLDPARPETLVYAEGPEGPVLIGAMFEMEGTGVAGPAVGGPLTVWHAHDHICLSLTPPGLAGVVSPFGTCPVGSVTIPVTNEMMHVFTIPGAPDRFGDLEDEWIRAAIGW